MNYLAGLLFGLLALVIQTVIFRYLNIWGAAPDLILLSVIVSSIYFNLRKALPVSFLFGFFQDILCYGAYSNTIIKTAVSALIVNYRDDFSGTGKQLAMNFVLIFTPLSLAGEALLMHFWLGKPIAWFSLAMLAVVQTLLNLLCLPLVIWIFRKLGHEQE